MKVAKLELKVIIAYMLAGYDYKVVDKNGAPLKSLPVPDRNDIHQVSAPIPPGDLELRH